MKYYKQQIRVFLKLFDILFKLPDKAFSYFRKLTLLQLKVA